VPIGLDDFGSSRASVLSLVRVRPDFVKFDGRLVDALTQPKVAPEALSAFAVLAHDCGASVIAEGVETASQADLLRDLGCDFLQGFHFARPMPAAALRELLTVDRP
jgi:EAL domain-containing protein (putative c-di-GMP-specific phosphodiesterase class I)